MFSKCVFARLGLFLMANKNILLSRRFLIGGALCLVAGTVAWSEITKLPFDGKAIDPPMAHQLAISGEITLLDIRRPDEWLKTGSAAGAHRLDMRQKDFVEVLDGLVAGDRSKPVALICARGVRSNRMSDKLSKAGFTNIIDVPEGMLGSKAGPGWLQRKLPVTK
jgi:rhodanese-related sulfurtransferase